MEVYDLCRHQTSTCFTLTHTAQWATSNNATKLITSEFCTLCSVSVHWGGDIQAQHRRGHDAASHDAFRTWHTADTCNSSSCSTSRQRPGFTRHVPKCNMCKRVTEVRWNTETGHLTYTAMRWRRSAMSQQCYQWQWVMNTFVITWLIINGNSLIAWDNDELLTCLYRNEYGKMTDHETSLQLCTQFFAILILLMIVRHVFLLFKPW